MKSRRLEDEKASDRKKDFLRIKSGEAFRGEELQHCY